MLVQSVQSQGYMMIWCADIRKSATIYKSSRLQECKHKQKDIIQPSLSFQCNFMACSSCGGKESEKKVKSIAWIAVDHLFVQCWTVSKWISSLCQTDRKKRKEHSSSCAKTCACILWPETQRGHTEPGIRKQREQECCNG